MFTSIVFSQNPVYLAKGPSVLSSVAWTFFLSFFTLFAPVSQTYLNLYIEKTGRVGGSIPAPTRTTPLVPTSIITTSYHGPDDPSTPTSIASLIALAVSVTLASAGTAYIVTKRGSSPKGEPPRPPPGAPIQCNPSPAPQDHEESEEDDAEDGGDDRNPADNTENVEGGENKNNDKRKKNPPFASGPPDDPSDPDPSPSEYFFEKLPFSQILSSHFYFWFLLSILFIISGSALADYMCPQHTRRIKNLVVAQHRRFKHHAERSINAWIIILTNVRQGRWDKTFINTLVVKEYSPRPVKVEMIADLAQYIAPNMTTNNTLKEATVNAEEEDARNTVFCVVASCVILLNAMGGVFRRAPKKGEDVGRIQEKLVDSDADESFALNSETGPIPVIEDTLQEEDGYFDVLDASLEVPYQEKIIRNDFDNSDKDVLSHITVDTIKENIFQQNDDVDFFDAVDTSLEGPTTHAQKGLDDLDEDKFTSCITITADKDEVVKDERETAFYRKGNVQENKGNAFSALVIPLEDPISSQPPVKIMDETETRESVLQVEGENTIFLDVHDVLEVFLEGSAPSTVFPSEPATEPKLVEMNMVDVCVDIEQITATVRETVESITDTPQDLLNNNKPKRVLVNNEEVKEDTEVGFASSADDVALLTVEVCKDVGREIQEGCEDANKVGVIKEETFTTLSIPNDTDRTFSSIKTPIDSFIFNDKKSLLTKPLQALPSPEVEVTLVEVPQSFPVFKERLLPSTSINILYQETVGLEVLDLIHRDEVEPGPVGPEEVVAVEDIVIDKDEVMALETGADEPGFALDTSATFELLDVIEVFYTQGNDRLLDHDIGPPEHVFPEFDGEIQQTIGTETSNLGLVGLLKHEPS